MDDYIRREDAVETIKKNFKYLPGYMNATINYIKDLPSADVVQVVRCKDCKFRENDDFCTGRGFPYQLVPDDGFCDKGKRKE